MAGTYIIKLLLFLSCGFDAVFTHRGHPHGGHDNFRPHLPRPDGPMHERLIGIENHVIELERKIDFLTMNINKVEPIPIDCEDVRKQSEEATIESGLYLIQTPGLLKRRVYCNFTEQESWTTISRRMNAEDIFNRSWIEYKNGFGKVSRDYWIGNEMLHKLTSTHNYYLRITMTGSCKRFTSSYNSFKVGDEGSQYLLQLGPYDSANSNGGDSFFPTSECNKNGQTSAPFSTYDSGNAQNCAKTMSGGWWFTNCGCSNLNGKFTFSYLPKNESSNTGIYWDSVYYNEFGYAFSLSKVVMEIRRI